MDSFPAGVSETLQYYIYRLIDPRNGDTFYVGKGKGNRLFDHLKAANAQDIAEIQKNDGREFEASEDEISLKIKRLQEIRAACLEVIHVIHRHGISDEKAAYEVEAALIDAYPGLSNLCAGHHSKERGPMHALEIQDKYALPEVELGDDKLLLININSADHTSNEELLERVRYAWRVSITRAEKASYVLAVIRGVVRGAFVAKTWLSATMENFPGKEESIRHRSGFHGEVAPAEVWERYVGDRGKRLPESSKLKSQNPIRYLNC